MATMNGGFRIDITYKNNDTWSFLRQESGWVEDLPSRLCGKPHSVSAERVLFHLLRALARPSNVINVRVLESE